MKVNLFDFATKELSQDAFLLWLVSNADKHYQEDESLHKVAQSFVRALIGPYKKEIVSVKVEKQWKHIDVAFSVNDDVFVIIEDKAGACLHGDQLERYQNDAIERAVHEDILRIPPPKNHKLLARPGTFVCNAKIFLKF